MMPRADCGDAQYKLENGSHERYTQDSVRESADDYRGRATRHEATFAELTKEHDELVAKRDETWKQMIAF